MNEDLMRVATGNVLGNAGSPNVGNPLGRSPSVANAGLQIGTCGALLLKRDGGYRYAIDPDRPAVRRLGAGETLEDLFGCQFADSRGALSGVVTLSILVLKTSEGPMVVDVTVTEAPELEEGGPELDFSYAQVSAGALVDMDFTMPR